MVSNDRRMVACSWRGVSSENDDMCGLRKFVACPVFLEKKFSSKSLLKSEFLRRQYGGRDMRVVDRRGEDQGLKLPLRGRRVFFFRWEKDCII